LNTADHNERVQKELGAAKATGATFRSAYNIYRWYLLRRKCRGRKLNTPEYEILADELENLQSVLPLVQADPRIGFHQEDQWRMFTPTTIKQKICQLEHNLADS